VGVVIVYVQGSTQRMYVELAMHAAIPYGLIMHSNHRSHHENPPTTSSHRNTTQQWLRGLAVR
jgi:hypothetical protein